STVPKTTAFRSFFVAVLTMPSASGAAGRLLTSTTSTPSDVPSASMTQRRTLSAPCPSNGATATLRPFDASSAGAARAGTAPATNVAVMLSASATRKQALDHFEGILVRCSSSPGAATGSESGRPQQHGSLSL